MPDPEPYFDPYVAFVPPTTKRAPVSSTGRRLPITPDQASVVASSYNRPPLPGLPSSQRPSAFHVPTYSSSSVHGPYSPEKAPDGLEDGESALEQVLTMSPTFHDSESTFQPPQVNVDHADNDTKIVDYGHHYSYSQPVVQPRAPSYGHSPSRSFVTSPSSQNREYMMPQPEVASLGRSSSLTPCERVNFISVTLTHIIPDGDSLSVRSVSSSHVPQLGQSSSSRNPTPSVGESSTYKGSRVDVPPRTPEEDDSFVAPPSPMQEQTYGEVRGPSEALHTLADFENTGTHDVQDPVEDYWDDAEEDGDRFINYFLLSHIAVQLRDKIPRGTHVKGSIPYHRGFTGKDIVVRISYVVMYSPSDVTLTYLI